MNWKIKARELWQKSWRFIKFVTYHFFKDDCTYRASALAFTSLLAIVPLMTVGLTILSSLPLFQGLISPIQDFIFQNFVPATGKIVQDYVTQFAAQVSRLPIWGLSFLLITAILLMYTIERSMNKIWRVNQDRRGIPALLLYWAILSLAPLFLGLSLTASSYLFSLPFMRQEQTPSFILSSLPFLFSFVGFTFLYVVVPNRPVKLRHGLWGGLVASILFETAKHAFAYYLGHYNTYQLLYGAFAAVPVFFVWVYWVWIITLLGAEICYALSVGYQRRQGEAISPFLQALFWLQHLWIEQKQGKGLSVESLINACAHPYQIDTAEMLNILEKLQLIHLSEDEHYYLSRDLGQISLYWLNQHFPYPMPNEKELQLCPANWQALLIKNNHQLQHSLNVPLAHLYDQEALSSK